METVTGTDNLEFTTSEFIAHMKSKGCKASVMSGRLYVHGLNGLAELLQCSKPTAYKLKDSGKVSYIRIGLKKLVFDVELVLRQLDIDGYSTFLGK